MQTRLVKRSAVLDRFVTYTFALNTFTVDDALAVMACDILPDIFDIYDGYQIQIYLNVDTEKVTAEGGTVPGQFHIITARYPINSSCLSNIQKDAAAKYLNHEPNGSGYLTTGVTQVIVKLYFIVRKGPSIPLSGEVGEYRPLPQNFPGARCLLNVKSKGDDCLPLSIMAHYEYKPNTRDFKTNCSCPTYLRKKFGSNHPELASYHGPVPQGDLHKFEERFKVAVTIYLVDTLKPPSEGKKDGRYKISLLHQGTPNYRENHCRLLTFDREHVVLITQYVQFYNSICQSRQAFSAAWPDKVPGKNSILNLTNINGDSLSINMIAHLAINNGARVNKSTCPLWLEQYNQDKKTSHIPTF